MSDGHWRSRKRFVAVSPEKSVAFQIANKEQARDTHGYEFFVKMIDCYDDFNDYLWDYGEIGY